MTDQIHRTRVEPTENQGLAPQHPEKKKGLPLGAKLGIIGGGALLVAGGAFGIGNVLNGQGQNQVPDKDPTSTSEVGPSNAPETDAYTVESLALSPDSITNPDAFMETFWKERVTAWINAGATPENAAISSDKGYNPEFTQEIAAQTDAIFIEALLEPGWEQNAELAGWVQNIKENHLSTLQFYFLTSEPDINPDDKKPYTRTTNFDSNISVVTNPDGTVSIQTVEHDSDNKDDNSIGERGGTTGVQGDSATSTITFTVGDSVRISNYVAG